MTTNKPTKKTVEMPKPGQLVRVNNRGGRDGYRRAGTKHPKGAVDHPHNKFDAAQLEALFADPRLDVRVVDVPAKEKPAE